MRLTHTIVFLFFAVFAGSALAQTAPRPASPASPAATPDATTASFGDWVLRSKKRNTGLNRCLRI